jgi:hypothetical protein
VARHAMAINFNDAVRRALKVKRFKDLHRNIGIPQADVGCSGAVPVRLAAAAALPGSGECQF